MGTLCQLVILISLSIYADSKFQRHRRQLIDEPGQQIDLNITVPYIFSARLYSYGANRGDILMNGRQELYQLENPIHFMGNAYDSVYISRDGSIGFSDKQQKSSALPVDEPTIAVFWQQATLGSVWYRETNDVNIVNLAHNEVNIQYRYGSQFRVKSVLLITWENTKDPVVPEADGNTFQLALILGDTMTFAHFIYSKLNHNLNAVAGFSSHQNHYSLPDSATQDAILLSEKSDIGIPGEWLFRVDEQKVYLCGAGFKGLECIESCSPSQWFNDCSRSCHCDGGDGCDQENGRCPNGKCSPGWEGEPICDKDIDECSGETHNCPNEQPDCLNTPGSFLCLCFEYDEDKQVCKGSKPFPLSAPIPVDIVPLQPSFTNPLSSTSRPPTHRNRFKSTAAATSPIFTPTTKIPTPAATTHRQTTLSTTEASTSSITTTTSEMIVPPACSRCDQNARCENGVCECLEGYTGDGFRCYDVDECEIDGAVCGAHSFCSNTIGSFECSCHGGYRLEDKQCVDIDECRESPRICGSNSNGIKCVNKDGSFECLCKEGYEGDVSTECKDINECLKADACGPNADCTNIEGGYECECDPGYERLAEGAHCTDRDECAVEPCHPAAICSNIRGSYKCDCIDGFVGDGKSCHETILYPISNDSIVIPRSWDSVTTIKFNHEITVFGKKYINAYLSTNGILSFEKPLHGLIDDVDNLKHPAIFALHSQFDYIRSGLEAYTFINESDTMTFPLIMRSSLSIQTALKLENFRTKNLHIFTFDQVRQSGSEHMNSFQIVIAESADATILTVIYEKVEARGSLVGISTGNKFHPLPNDRVAIKSNIGQPGKWMFRIDNVELQPCPSGRLGEPFCEKECESGRYGVDCKSTCHCDNSVACNIVSGVCPGKLCRAGWEGESCDQDIDECLMSLVTCAHGSECVNTQGGYRCDCKKGFILNGKECQPVDECQMHYDIPCSRNAECQKQSMSEPKCVCQKGYHGDGFRCSNRSESKISTGKDMVNYLMGEAIDTKNANFSDTSIINEQENDRPFVMTKWIPEQSETAKPASPAIQKFVTVQTPPLLYTAPPIKPTMKRDDINESEQNKVEGNDGVSSAFIILPLSLVLVWIVLIVVVIALYLMSRRKRQARERQQYSRTWKTSAGLPISSRMITSSAVSNSNVMYGRTPRITTYEGY